MPAMNVIAHIHTDFPQKFGIPRQSGIAASTRGVITFQPEYAINDAVRGLEGFSHLWLIWQFEDTEGKGAHRTEGEGERGWSPTVRPPRLGGKKRLGVFATRSPYRPNAIGLSSVELERVELTDDGPRLHVLGADLRDGTPILDIKPYLPYTDCHADATGGFAEDVRQDTYLQVNANPRLLERIPADKQEALLDVLAQDPRPAFAKDGAKEYKMAFASWDVSFMVENGTLTVTAIDSRLAPTQK